MSDAEQTYAGNNHVIGRGLHMALGNPPVLLRDRGREWLMEWHYYFGPTRLHKKTQDVLANQPGEKSRFWLASQCWRDQGCRVVDGVAIWDEPPIVIQTPSPAKL